MKNKYYISASIICSDFKNLKKDISLLEKSKVDFIHIDIMDGKFVPRLGIFPEIIQTIKSLTSIPLDVHLMISDPIKFIPLIASYGADYITIHVESTSKIKQCIKLIKDNNKKVGIAFSPKTPVSKVKKYINDVDILTVMGIYPGILGQSLIEDTYNKLFLLNKIIPKSKNIYIEVDGGVNFTTSAKLIKSGANVLVCGSSTIFNQRKPINYQVNKLHQKINNEI